MDPAEYHKWYETDRGRWIGEVEFRLAKRLLDARAGESILDVGCGTGYFTHRFAQTGANVIGVDPGIDWIAFAAARASSGERYVGGRAERLPFADHSFDRVVSVAALCFIADPRPGLAEIVRVARRSFAVGLLNRSSTLYLGKGRDGGSGAYRGARWYTPRELHAMFDGLAATRLKTRTAVFDARGALPSRMLERLLPNTAPRGALVFVAGEVVRESSQALGRQRAG